MSTPQRAPDLDDGSPRGACDRTTSNRSNQAALSHSGPDGYRRGELPGARVLRLDVYTYGSAYTSGEPRNAYQYRDRREAHVGGVAHHRSAHEAPGCRGLVETHDSVEAPGADPQRPRKAQVARRPRGNAARRVTRGPRRYVRLDRLLQRHCLASSRSSRCTFGYGRASYR